MTKSTSRFATKQEAEAGVKFCHIRIEVERNNIMIKRCGDIVPKIIGRDNVYRFSCLGAIDWVELGEVRMSSAGEYGMTANIIDYAGNAEECIQTAKKFAENQRNVYVTKLQKHINQMMSTNIVVQ